MNVIDQQSNTTIIIFSKYINAELTEGNVPGSFICERGRTFFNESQTLFRRRRPGLMLDSS